MKKTGFAIRRRIDDKSRVVIPREILDFLGIKKGGELVFYIHNGRICIESGENGK